MLKLSIKAFLATFHWSVNHPDLFCELSFHGVVIQIAGIAEQLAVRRIHDGDPELHDVLLVVFFNQVGVFFDLSVTKRKDGVVRQMLFQKSQKLLICLNFVGRLNDIAVGR